MSVASKAHEIARGTLLAGKYRIESELGRGGMGVVLAAEHVELGGRVALKLMLPAALERPGADARFLREARAAVRIKGDHVARVLDVGRLDSGEPYIVMEHLEGEDLGSLLRREGAFSAEMAADYVLQACEAIAEAHALGIVHRDLKPSNLFLTRRPDGSPFVKVLDFGISKVLEPDSGVTSAEELVVTHPRQMLGSPLYMAPEQLTSARSVVPASDIWSLGAILFELCSGAPPFAGATLGELRRQILFEDAPALRGLRPDLPRRLETIVQRCLEKDPARRFEDVAAFAEALAELGSERARDTAGRVRGILLHAGAEEALSGRRRPTGRQGRVRWALFGSAAVLVGGIVVGVRFGDRGPLGAQGALTPDPETPPGTGENMKPHGHAPSPGDAADLNPMPASEGSEPSAPSAPSAAMAAALTAEVRPLGPSASPAARASASWRRAPQPTPTGTSTTTSSSRPASAPPAASSSVPFLYSAPPLK
ncbi:serine/threonine-protein kinase [Chondromyces crocatus]|uniref:serine/threonine-protein kinase n=1 Tax=Chondromyces crocatus TaxID=52 RepID=UPI001C54E971|nr:serine/threonine-protein kinase [Chondromyces crocatus]